jgi:YVTN family beta-propeller protein
MRFRSLFVLPALAGLALLATRVVPGRLRDGSTLLPSGWRIRPAGRTVAVGTLPLGLALLSDGSLMVANSGYGPTGLMRIDPVKGAVVWQKTLPAWLGLARSGSDWRDTVWVSGAGTNRVYRLAWQGGMTWTLDSVALADASARLFPAGIALVPRRGLVAVVGNVSDSVYLVDAATLARRGSVAVGRRPFGAVADSAHLYVSDWGDSTVSVIDLSASPPVRLAAIHVGPHPSALALRGPDLYVALAGANAVARVDLRTGVVVEQLAVALSPGAPTGSDPNALALSPDGRTLYVAMAGNNAVAVVRIGRTGMRVAGLVPAGWYPTGVATSADGHTLFVANGKGNGSGANRDGTYIGDVITGSVSIVPMPDDAALARYTREVYALSPYSNPRLRNAVADRPSARPPVRHVVYIIRENRTYDQVLGDVGGGANGDPELAIFNDSITPNAHAIARRWVVFDNFYVNGEVSADGHEWSDRAFAGDYNEKTWPQIYGHGRNWDLEDGDDLVNPHGAYLWDAARRKGLWVVNFGERAETDSGPSGSTHTALSGLDSITVASYPAFRLEIRDTTRARLFADSIASWDRQGRFPDLVFLWLPRDHTYGRAAGKATPRSMVADNDLALGQVIERLSVSPAWASLAVFVLEDDAQNGPDHVDAHRSVLLVASPYAKSGVVDSTFYTTSSVVRSIGLLLGLPPLSQYDSAAAPLWSAFSTRAIATPYAALPNRWSLDELNPEAYRSTIPPSDFAVADRADEVVLNREIWESVHPRRAAPPVRRTWVMRERGR